MNASLKPGPPAHDLLRHLRMRTRLEHQLFKRLFLSSSPGPSRPARPVAASRPID